MGGWYVIGGRGLAVIAAICALALSAGIALAADVGFVDVPDGTTVTITGADGKTQTITGETKNVKISTGDRISTTDGRRATIRFTVPKPGDASVTLLKDSTVVVGGVATDDKGNSTVDVELVKGQADGDNYSGTKLVVKAGPAKTESQADKNQANHFSVGIDSNGTVTTAKGHNATALPEGTVVMDNQVIGTDSKLSRSPRGAYKGESLSPDEDQTDGASKPVKGLVIITDEEMRRINEGFDEENRLKREAEKQNGGDGKKPEGKKDGSDTGTEKRNSPQDPKQSTKEKESQSDNGGQSPD